MKVRSHDTLATATATAIDASSRSQCKPVADGRVVSMLDCSAGGLSFKSDIPPLMKHPSEEQ